MQTGAASSSTTAETRPFCYMKAPGWRLRSAMTGFCQREPRGPSDRARRAVGEGFYLTVHKNKTMSNPIIGKIGHVGSSATVGVFDSHVCMILCDDVTELMATVDTLSSLRMVGLVCGDVLRATYDKPKMTDTSEQTMRRQPFEGRWCRWQQYVQG